jgi:hypothetical protein
VLYESIKKALVEADGVQEEREEIIISDSDDEV